MPTILVIEDTIDLVEVIRRELQAAGYSVLHAGDGLTGLELDDRFDPDLIILDWSLPQLDGPEVLRRLRQSSDVPVLMLTERGEEVDRQGIPDLASDDFLAKPFAMSALISRVGVLLRRSGMAFEALARASASGE